MTDRHRSSRRQLPPTPLGWKLWFAFCALVTLGLTGLLVWLLVDVIAWLHRQG